MQKPVLARVVQQSRPVRQPHLGSSARRVLSKLRGSADTVDGLATSLGVTENAVRTQLHKLERLGLVTRISRRPSTSKPAVVFGITSEGQAAFSAAYAPVLRELVSSAVELFPSPKVDALMRKCGERIAADFGEPPSRLSERISGAARILNALGGNAAVTRTGKSFALESSGCPLSAVTSTNPAACKIVESIVRRYVRAPVEICCHIRDNPRCCFLISPKASAQQLV